MYIYNLKNIILCIHIYIYKFKMCYDSVILSITYIYIYGNIFPFNITYLYNSFITSHIKVVC